MVIDPTIQLGHVVEGIVALATALGVIFTVRADNRHVKSEMSDMKRELSKITEVLVLLGRQDERIKILERSYEKDE